MSDETKGKGEDQGKEQSEAALRREALPEQDFYQSRMEIYGKMNQTRREVEQSEREHIDGGEASQDMMEARLWAESRGEEWPDTDEGQQDLISRMEAEARGEEPPEPGAEEPEPEPGEGEEPGKEAQTTEKGQETPGSEPGEVDQLGEDGYTEVKVYGETYRVPNEDIERAGGLRAYQKDRAASIKFQQLAAEEAQLREREQRLAEQEATLREKGHPQAVTPQPAQPAPGTEPPSEGARGNEAVVSEEQVKKWREAMYSGNTEEMDAALLEIAQMRTAGPTVDENQLLDRLEARLEQSQRVREQREEAARRDGLLEQWQRDREAQEKEVNRVMAEEYGDLFKDQELLEFAQNKYLKMVRDPGNMGRSLPDIAREAGEAARRVSGLRSPEERLDARRERKRRIPTTTAHQRRPSGDEEKESSPQTRSDAVAMMKKARGQDATAVEFTRR